jgi:hypothetical protein
MLGGGGGNVDDEGCDEGRQWSGHVARRGGEQPSRGSNAPLGGNPYGVLGMIEVTASEVAPATTLLEVGDAPGVKPGG